MSEAQPTGFTALATPDHVALGERFLYRIEIQDRPEVTYALPDPLKVGDSFEVISRSNQKLDTADPKLKTTRIDLTLSQFELGEHAIADLTLTAQTPEGPQTLAIPGPRVTVTEQVPKGEAMAQSVPPVEMKVLNTPLLAWGGGILLALLVALLGIRAWLRWRRRRPVPEPVLTSSAIPPQETALAALEALAHEKLYDQGRTREHWFRLSEILRTYLGRRFHFNAIDLTREELLSACHPFASHGLDLPRLARFCLEADFAKFAKAEPDPSSSRAGIEEARAFVEATR